jgi:hypothetical protein
MSLTKSELAKLCEIVENTRKTAKDVELLKAAQSIVDETWGKAKADVLEDPTQALEFPPVFPAVPETPACREPEGPKATIIRNAAKCQHCGDVVESKHRHDYRSCKCGRIAVDGGQDYLRRVFENKGDLIELSEWE